MSATENQNNGDVAVEKVAAAGDAVDATPVKEDLKKPAVDDTTAAAEDNGNTKGAEADDEDTSDAAPIREVKGTKRSAESKSSDSKKAKRERPVPDNGDSDDEEILEEIECDSDIESDEYDIPYGEEDDEIDDGSDSDDQA